MTRWCRVSRRVDAAFCGGPSVEARAALALLATLTELLAFGAGLLADPLPPFRRLVVVYGPM